MQTVKPVLKITSTLVLRKQVLICCTCLHVQIMVKQVLQFYTSLHIKSLVTKCEHFHLQCVSNTRLLKCTVCYSLWMFKIIQCNTIILWFITVHGSKIIPDPPAKRNDARREFCKKYDGYGEFCARKFNSKTSLYPCRGCARKFSQASYYSCIQKVLSS